LRPSWGRDAQPHGPVRGLAPERPRDPHCAGRSSHYNSRYRRGSIGTPTAGGGIMNRIVERLRLRLSVLLATMFANGCAGGLFNASSSTPSPVPATSGTATNFEVVRLFGYTELESHHGGVTEIAFSPHPIGPTPIHLRRLIATAHNEG